MTHKVTALTLRDRLRSRSVKRWHTVSTSISQSVADHSHNMGIIAEQLLYEVCSPIGEPSIEHQYWVLKYCQIHDLPELITGDLSSVFKSWLKESIPDFSNVWDSLERELIPELEDVDEVFFNFPYLKYVCKAADVLEAYNFIMLSKGLDEQHNQVIIDKLENMLQAMVAKFKLKQPLYNWERIFKVKTEMLEGNSVVINLEDVFSR